MDMEQTRHQTVGFQKKTSTKMGIELLTFGFVGKQRITRPSTSPITRLSVSIKSSVGTVGLDHSR